MTRIKVCGITNLSDALRAADFGAHAIGFVFTDSPRRIEPEIARTISLALPPFVSRVGVFASELPHVIEDRINFCRLDTVQIGATDSGADDYQFDAAVIRSFRVEGADIIAAIRRSQVECFLMDTYHPACNGGSGKAFDWSIAREAAKLGRVILAGGLNPGNIVAALEAVHPYAVDVSSGVEASPGLKDHEKMQSFIHEVRKWDNRID